MLLNNNKQHILTMQKKAGRGIIVLFCSFLSIMVLILLGISVWLICKTHRLETQIHQMMEQIKTDANLETLLDQIDVYLDEEFTDNGKDYNDFIVPEKYDEFKTDEVSTEEGFIITNDTRKRNRRDVADPDLNLDESEQRSNIGYNTERTSNEFYDEVPSESPPYDTRRYYRNYRYPPRNTDLGSSDLSQEQESYSNTNIRNRMRSHKQNRQTRRTKLLPAIHFHGDTSRYVYGEHENYNGNGHLHHPNTLIVDWITHDWVRHLGMNQYFSFKEGNLTIGEAGLYLIYAQIYYIDIHDSTGFSVNKNDIPILQCARDTKSSTAINKTNTCFTAGAEYFHENDIVSIKESFHERYSVFKPGKSFFGLIKLGDLKPL